MDTQQEITSEAQLFLQGLEPVHQSGSDGLTLFRRRSDRSVPREESRSETTTPPRVIEGSADKWTVVIYTLGRFSLLLDGLPADFGRKIPHRPLELLKTLVALGGREIPVTKLTTVMWPDADGDIAQRSFDTTLHRLRKLLGDQRAVLLRDSKVSLNSNHCWTDVWFFERLIGQIQRIMNTDVNGKDAASLDQLSEKIMSTYQGHFLSLEDVTPWSVSIRERLRSKYIHTLLALGRYWELHRLWDRAMSCYQKGLELDDLLEVFYQRLMICCLETRRFSEGMAMYRRCRYILGVVLDLQPEPLTEEIYQELRFLRSM